MINQIKTFSFWFGLTWTLMTVCLSEVAISQDGEIELSGFFTATYSQSDDSAYYLGDVHSGGINKDGSFLGTLMGINLASQVSERISFASQLLASAEGNENQDHFMVALDWAFVTVHLNNDFGLRAGKIKLPVGLVNEYVDVGTAYPWIRPPELIYTEQASGPQATRESFVGGSLVFNKYWGDFDLSVDVYGGEIDLEEMHIKKMRGLRFSADWQDQFQFQVSAYQGQMIAEDPNSPMGAMMHEQDHAAVVVGGSCDWNNLVFYAEYALVDMDIQMMTMGMTELSSALDGEAYYFTVGYRISRWLPHFTHQEWDRDNGLQHSIDTAGLNYQLFPTTVLKIEYSAVSTQAGAMMMEPVTGLFSSLPESDPVSIISTSLSVTF